MLLVELSTVHACGHSAGEHLVRFASGSEVVTRGPVDVRTAVGGTDTKGVGGRIVVARLLIARAWTSLGEVGIENPNRTRRSNSNAENRPALWCILNIVFGIREVC